MVTKLTPKQREVFELAVSELRCHSLSLAQQKVQVERERLVVGSAVESLSRVIELGREALKEQP